MKYKYIFLFFFILLISGCTSKEQTYEKDMLYMDTYINIKIYTSNEELANKALKEADKIYSEYHKLSDRYHTYKDITNVYNINNDLKVGESLTVDKKLYNLINYSFTFCKDSNGLLNIAMGHVIDIWKLYRDGVKTGLPTNDELQNSGSIKLYDLVLKPDNKITKLSDISIDLGAFAKGYATEKVGAYLESVGISKYIINAGGNVKVGKHYDNGKYRIGIEKPTIEGGLYKTVKGNNISVTTSGSYERFYEYDGKIYSHIIDPQTLYPSAYMLSVTVISKDSALSDAMDTMLFLMPIEDGIKYVDKLKDVEAVWYGVDNKLYYSKGFNKYE